MRTDDATKDSEETANPQIKIQENVARSLIEAVIVLGALQPLSSYS